MASLLTDLFQHELIGKCGRLVLRALCPVLTNTVSYSVGPANIDGLSILVERIDPLPGEISQAILDCVWRTIQEFLKQGLHLVDDLLEIRVNWEPLMGKG